MSSDRAVFPLPDDADVYLTDPSDVFSIGAVVNDDDDLGTLLWATVHERWTNILACTRVTVRIVPLSDAQEANVRHVVSQVSYAASRDEWRAAHILRFVGVWHSAVGETWIVSERLNTAVTLRQILLSSVSQQSSTRDPSDLESFTGFVIQQVLNILDWLHTDPKISHGYITIGNIHVCEDGSVWLSDVGIYDVLCDALRSRRTFPGEKPWAFAGPDADLIDLGVVAAMIVESPSVVSRMWRAGWKAPRVGSASRELLHVSSYLSYVFGLSKTSTESVPTGLCLSYLRNLPFVREATDAECRTLVQEYWKWHEDASTLSDGNPMDLIGRLFRENEVVVRAPLINVDDLSTEFFEYERWIGNDVNRPTAEQALVRVVKTCKERALTRDIEEVRSRGALVSTLETFMNTADML